MTVCETPFLPYGRHRIEPPLNFCMSGKYKKAPQVPDGFRYASDANDEWLEGDELAKLVGSVD